MLNFLFKWKDIYLEDIANKTSYFCNRSEDWYYKKTFYALILNWHFKKNGECWKLGFKNVGMTNKSPESQFGNRWSATDHNPHLPSSKKWPAGDLLNYKNIHQSKEKRTTKIWSTDQ